MANLNGVEIEGLRELEIAIDKLTPEIELLMTKLVEEAGITAQKEIIHAYNSGTRTGKIYHKGNGVYHQASAPGEPPKSDSGNLASHIYFKKVDRLSVEVYSDKSAAPYGFWLEYGTLDGRIAPRPLWVPKRDDIGERFFRAVEEHLGDYIRAKSA